MTANAVAVAVENCSWGVAALDLAGDNRCNSAAALAVEVGTGHQSTEAVMGLRNVRYCILDIRTYQDR